MKKSEYLEDFEVSSFLDYFKAIVFGDRGSFCQKYTPTKQGEVFSINSFREAFEQYQWEGIGFDENNAQLTAISRELNRGLSHSRNDTALIQSLKVLDWGGVVIRYSVRWLVDGCDADNICSSITKAASILNSEDDEKIRNFANNVKLRSDSATTKIFALVGEKEKERKSVVYDNRVGAAMARLVRSYLESCFAVDVPEYLNFMRGEGARGSRRNPSTKQYKFHKKQAGELHALSNIRANWLIQEIVKDSRFENYFRCAGESDSHKMRMIEAALFMIGYNLTTIEKIKVPKKRLAKRIFLKGQIERSSPKEIKQSFINDVPLTKKGANTYYYNFTHQIW